MNSGQERESIRRAARGRHWVSASASMTRPTWPGATDVRSSSVPVRGNDKQGTLPDWETILGGNGSVRVVGSDRVQKDISSIRSCREKCLRRDLSSSLTTDSMSRLFFDMMESIFSSSVFSVMSLKT